MGYFSQMLRNNNLGHKGNMERIKRIEKSIGYREMTEKEKKDPKYIATSKHAEGKTHGELIREKEKNKVPVRIKNRP